MKSKSIEATDAPSLRAPDWRSEVVISVGVPHVLLLFLSRPEQ